MEVEDDSGIPYPQQQHNAAMVAQQQAMLLQQHAVGYCSSLGVTVAG